MEKFIKLFHLVQGMGPFSLFQNLALGKASTDDECHFAISWVRCCQNEHECKISSRFPLSSRDRTLSLFQNLELAKAWIDDKCHFAFPWARYCQYQCLCKSFSQYFKRFNSYRHSSQTVRWQNLHKLSCDKIKCLSIGHTLKVNLQFPLAF